MPSYVVIVRAQTTVLVIDAQNDAEARRFAEEQVTFGRRWEHDNSQATEIADDQIEAAKKSAHHVSEPNL